MMAGYDANSSPGAPVTVGDVRAVVASATTQNAITVTDTPVSTQNTAVAAGISSLTTNNTSTVGTTGHMIGVIGRVADSTTGRITMYGLEGRTDGRTTDAAATHTYYGASGQAHFQGSSLANTVLCIGIEGLVDITTDGSTPLAGGIAACFYAPTIVGGASKYALYAVSNSCFFGGGFSTAGTGVASSGLLNVLSGTPVASAGTITITGNLFHVTGNTTITSVSGTTVPAGTQITIIFDGALTFTDGSNLKLAGNFVTTADDTITLIYDGTNWYEVCRSVN